MIIPDRGVDSSRQPIHRRRSQKEAKPFMKMNGFSAHADRDELATYVKHIPGLKSVFVVM